jgi:hypothetical protein
MASTAKIPAMPQLRVISEAEVGDREVQSVEYEGEVPLVNTVLLTRQPDRSEPVYTCGRCNAQLMIGVEPHEAPNFVLLCPACRALNETPGG